MKKRPKPVVKRRPVSIFNSTRLRGLRESVNDNPSHSLILTRHGKAIMVVLHPYEFERLTGVTTDDPILPVPKTVPKAGSKAGAKK